MEQPKPRTTQEKRLFEAKWDAAVKRFEQKCKDEGTHRPRTWTRPPLPCVRCGGM